MNDSIETTADDGQGAQEPDPDPPPESPPPESSPPKVGDRECCSGYDSDGGEPDIEIIQNTGSDVDFAWVRDRLIEAMAHVGRPVARVCVNVVDDEAMTRLHRQHCRVDETTDVLTFPASAEPDWEGAIDVDIAVCADEAGRRAAERGYPVARELLLYALHGLLHAAGYDDHEEADYRAMHNEEDRILQAIGVGSTFTSDSSGHDDDRPVDSRVTRTQS